MIHPPTHPPTHTHTHKHRTDTSRRRQRARSSLSLSAFSKALSIVHILKDTLYSAFIFIF